METPAQRRGPRARQLLAALHDEIVRIGRVPREQITADSVLILLGIDSLKVLELSAFAERRFGATLPPDRWLADQTIGQLVDELVGYFPEDDEAEPPATTPARLTLVSEPEPDGALAFSLMFAGRMASHDDVTLLGLVREAARFADAHGLHAIWLPERHGRARGGLHSEPAVIAAVLAGVTHSLRLRANLTAPLHEPTHLAERWAAIDLVSGGRVGLALGSGELPDEFVLGPEPFVDRKERLHRCAAELRELWRGGTVARVAGSGQAIAARTYPRPMQPELGVWLDCPGEVDGFLRAGRDGHHVLTELGFQSPQELAIKIALYRAAYADGNHPGAGRVAVALPTFIAASRREVDEQARAGFLAYLEACAGRWLGHEEQAAWREVGGRAALLADAYARFSGRAALLGTVDECGALVGELRAAGVDEIACVVDFGVEATRIVEALPLLVQLSRRYAADDAVHGAVRHG